MIVCVRVLCEILRTRITRTPDKCKLGRSAIVGKNLLSCEVNDGVLQSIISTDGNKISIRGICLMNKCKIPRILIYEQMQNSPYFDIGHGQVDVEAI